MARTLERIVTLMLGWLLVALGVVGLFLPVLQGVLLLLLGFYVLSRESRWAKRKFDQLRARFPELDASVQRFADRLRAWRQR
jgi:uncharacterized membrane protein YbaN (DUF454 family)